MNKETEERIAQLKAEIARLEKTDEWKPCLCWLSDAYEIPSSENAKLIAFVSEKKPESRTGRVYVVPGIGNYAHATPLTREEWLEFEPEPRQGVAYVKPDSPLPSRYDWPEILKVEPEAQWASTDANGRIDCWDQKPEISEKLGAWDCVNFGQQCTHLNNGNHHPCTDWRNSLEARPEGI